MADAPDIPGSGAIQTDCERIARELKEAQEHAEQLDRFMPAGMFTVDREQRITSWNRKAAQLTGYSKNEMLNQKCLFFAENPCNNEFKLLDDAAAEPILEKECVIRCKNGAKRVILKQANVIRDANGIVTGGIEVFEDITEIKRAEASALAEKELNELLLNSLPYPAMLINCQRTILAANRTALEHGARVGGQCWREFGKAAFLQGEMLERHRCGETRDICCWFCQADRAFETRQALSSEIEMFGRIWDTHWDPIDKEKGLYLHYAVDITNRKQTENELKAHRDNLHDMVETRTAVLKEVNARLRQELIERKFIEEEALAQQEQVAQAGKMIALGTLVSGVAHEINNPANFVMLNGPLLQEAWTGITPILEEYFREHGDFMAGSINYSRLRGNVTELFRGIKAGAERIRDIVKELKDFAKQDDSSLTDSIDLNETIKSAASLLQNCIRQRTQHFKVEYAKNLPQVRGSSQKIEQVMINLIQNACESLATREKRVFVRTLHDADKRQVIVEIRDEGSGVSKENMSRILDPFFTTKRDKGGTGLGLSITAKIVETHNGILHFVSESGNGTIVTVAFPAMAKQEIGAVLNDL